MADQSSLDHIKDWKENQSVISAADYNALVRQVRNLGRMLPGANATGFVSPTEISLSSSSVPEQSTVMVWNDSGRDVNAYCVIALIEPIPNPATAAVESRQSGFPTRWIMRGKHPTEVASQELLDKYAAAIPMDCIPAHGCGYCVVDGMTPARLSLVPGISTVTAGMSTTKTVLTSSEIGGVRIIWSSGVASPTDPGEYAIVLLGTAITSVSVTAWVQIRQSRAFAAGIWSYSGVGWGDDENDPRFATNIFNLVNTCEFGNGVCPDGYWGNGYKDEWGQYSRQRIAPIRGCPVVLATKYTDAAWWFTLPNAMDVECLTP